MDGWVKGGMRYFIGELPGEDGGGVFVSGYNFADVVFVGGEDGGVGIEFRLRMRGPEEVGHVVDLAAVVGPLAFLTGVSGSGGRVCCWGRRHYLTKLMMNWMPAASACWTALSSSARPLAPVLRLGWPLSHSW